MKNYIEYSVTGCTTNGRFVSAGFFPTYEEAKFMLDNMGAHFSNLASATLYGWTEPSDSDTLPDELEDLYFD